MFTRITPTYDNVNRVLSMGLDRGWRRKVVRMAGLGPGDKAADVCTGTGDLALLLADAVGRKGEVVGVDFCQDMLARAAVKGPSARWPQLRFEVGDALRLPLEDQRYDVATMACGLRNLEDTEQGFRELKRILVPGGRVLVLELTRPAGWLKWLYYPYLFVLLPMVGGIVSRDFKAYRYLARSIAQFLPVPGLLAQMESVGFREVHAIPLLGGIATILYGVA